VAAVEKHILDALSGEVEGAGAAGGVESIDYVIDGGGAGCVDLLGGKIDAHAGEALDDALGAGGAVGDAGEFDFFGLEAMDEIDGAGEGVVFEIDGAVEV
jgi:hypothetical protein